MPGIQVDGISKRFGHRQVLEDISFQAPPGHLMTIIGPSGSGKTTLFRTILGELPPDDGRILLDDQDITHSPLRRRGVGTVYQSYALFPHMTVADNVGFGLRVRRVAEAEYRARVKEMLELARITEHATKYPHELSGGERQRVAVARALAVRPKALLLDEAFTALDANTRHQVVEEVRHIIKSLKLTTLLITHDQEEAFMFARRVLVLNEGKTVTMGNPEEIMAHPHPFIQSFVKMLLFRKAKVEKTPTGQAYVVVDNAHIPIHIPGVQVGDEVHVMVKKGPEAESVKVWPRE